MPDPYRALEDPDAEVTKRFVDQLNAVSKPFYEACGIRDKINQTCALARQPTTLAPAAD